MRREPVDERAPEQTPTEHADAFDGPDLARRFMHELSANVRRRPAPLPVAYRPMAEAITGDRARTVMLSTDTASRRALRKVGKVAATTDNVIHLAEAPSTTPSTRVNELIAHELTHVAHPSPVARFFDDVDDSPEERQAERVARVMASSPIAPTASTLAPGRAAPARPEPDRSRVVRRSPAAAAPPGTTASSSGSSSGLSAAALAASITGSGPDTVRRWASATPTDAQPTLGSHRSGAPNGSVASSEDALTTSDHTGVESRSDEWLMEQWERNLDRIVASLERRILVELERRGGRIWRGI